MHILHVCEFECYLSSTDLTLIPAPKRLYNLHKPYSVTHLLRSLLSNYGRRYNTRPWSTATIHLSIMLDCIHLCGGSKYAFTRNVSVQQFVHATTAAGVHYRSDHHRYNMKRRVANLPPVSVAVFNQKVLDRRQETAIMASPRGSVCEVCK